MFLRASEGLTCKTVFFNAELTLKTIWIQEYIFFCLDLQNNILHFSNDLYQALKIPSVRKLFIIGKYNYRITGLLFNRLFFWSSDSPERAHYI